MYAYTIELVCYLAYQSSACIYMFGKSDAVVLTILVPYVCQYYLCHRCHIFYLVTTELFFNIKETYLKFTIIKIYVPKCPKNLLLLGILEYVLSPNDVCINDR